MPPAQARSTATDPIGYLTPKTLDKAREGAVVRFKQHRTNPTDIPMHAHPAIDNDTLGKFKLALEKELNARGVDVSGRALDDSVDMTIGILVGN